MSDFQSWITSLILAESHLSGIINSASFTDGPMRSELIEMIERLDEMIVQLGPIARKERDDKPSEDLCS